MRLAAIDIGSNAIRMLISNVMEYEGKVYFKKVEYTRVPVRLGNDVFHLGYITPASQAKLLKLMQAFKNLMELFEVEDYMICATSAMRDAANGYAVADFIKEQTNLPIAIIDGSQEAEMIAGTISAFLEEGFFLHIDVGGGSTELNLYEGSTLLGSRSFQIGSVRNIAAQNESLWYEIIDWIQQFSGVVDKAQLLAIGTGGNITKLYELASQRGERKIGLEELGRLRNLLNSYSVEKRQAELQLNNDRADVIVPAADIYIKIMQLSGATQMLVPDKSLRDGMIMQLYQKNQLLKAGS